MSLNVGSVVVDAKLESKDFDSSLERIENKLGELSNVGIDVNANDNATEQLEGIKTKTEEIDALEANVDVEVEVDSNADDAISDMQDLDTEISSLSDGNVDIDTNSTDVIGEIEDVQDALDNLSGPSVDIGLEGGSGSGGGGGDGGDAGDDGIGTLGKIAGIASASGLLTKAAVTLGIASGGTAIAIGAAMAAVGSAAIKYTNNQREMNAVIMSGTGMSEEQADEIRILSKEYSTASVDSKDIAAASADVMTVFGLEGEEAVKLGFAVAQMGSITGESAGTMLTLAKGIMESSGSTDEAIEKMNMLAGVNTVSIISFKDINKQYTNNKNDLDELGISQEDYIEFMATTGATTKEEAILASDNLMKSMKNEGLSFDEAKELHGNDEAAMASWEEQKRKSKEETDKFVKSTDEENLSIQGLVTGGLKKGFDKTTAYTESLRKNWKEKRKLKKENKELEDSESDLSDSIGDSNENVEKSNGLFGGLFRRNGTNGINIDTGTVNSNTLNGEITAYANVTNVNTVHLDSTQISRQVTSDIKTIRTGRN